MKLLHENSSQRYVTWLKAFVFGLWMLKAVLDPIQDLAMLPQSIFTRTMPLTLVPGSVIRFLLSGEGLLLLRFGVVLACAICLVPKTARWSYPVACVLITTYQAVLRGYGHVNHAEVPLILAAYLLCISAFFRFGDRRPEPLVISFVFLGSYMLTGAYRLVYGGWDLFSSDTLTFWMGDHSLHPTTFHFGAGMWIVAHPECWVFLKVLFVIATLAETIAPLALISPGFRRFFLVTMIGFHLFNLVAMNILFWENVALLVFLLGVRSDGVVGQRRAAADAESLDR